MSDIQNDVAVLDEFLQNAPPEVVLSWRRIRAEIRRARRISQTALPATALAAQHAVLARDHAQKSIEAMSGITTPIPEKDEEK